MQGSACLCVDLNAVIVPGRSRVWKARTGSAQGEENECAAQDPGGVRLFSRTRQRNVHLEGGGWPDSQNKHSGCRGLGNRISASGLVLHESRGKVPREKAR